MHQVYAVKILSSLCSQFYFFGYFIFPHCHTDMFQFLIIILNYCFNFLLNCWISIPCDHIEFCFNFLLNCSSFNIMWPYCIVVSIYHWINVLIFVITFNWCFNPHIKNTKTIQRLYNIDIILNMKRHITCVFSHPYWWVGIG